MSALGTTPPSFGTLVAKIIPKFERTSLVRTSAAVRCYHCQGTRVSSSTNVPGRMVPCLEVGRGLGHTFMTQPPTCSLHTFSAVKVPEGGQFGVYSLPPLHVTSGMGHVLEPKSVALVGATDRAGSVGGTILKNLKEGFAAVGRDVPIYPINPKRKECLGLKCYASLKEIPHEVDLVVFVTPAASCVDLMKDAVEKGVKAAIVISAGFKEAGSAGVALESQLLEIARKGNIRIIGPNCLGVMNPNYGLNATFAADMGLGGRIGFISQSGAMCTAVLDWSLLERIGFSAFLSIGSMADVNWGDLMDYLGDDPATSCILIYMESIGNAQSFISAAKEVCPKKPIIVLKAGKTEQAASAAASHTGSLAGSHASFEAAMKKVGVLVADNIGELFNYASFLGRQPVPKGPKLLMITNAGGPAVLATDAAVESGAVIAKVSQEIVTKLDDFLPSAWSRSNPVDILGDAPPERYAKTLEILMDDPNSDGVLVILAPQDVTDPTTTAKHLIDAVQKYKQLHNGTLPKPVLASWMGGAAVAEGFRMLNEAGVPCFIRSDEAATAFGKIWKQREAIEKLYKRPDDEVLTHSKGTSSDMVPQSVSRSKALSVIQRARDENRTLLTEAESKAVLEAYGVPTIPTAVAGSASEALSLATSMSNKTGISKFAIKINSKTLTHKADVGGVKLNVPLEEIKSAYEEIERSVVSLKGPSHFNGVSVQPMAPTEKAIELIMGSTVDKQFGPLVLFGSGGTTVEIFKDAATALPPLSLNEADSLMKETKIYKALKGAQGKRFEKVDLQGLTHALKGFSDLVADLSDVISECDINPVLARKDTLVALDARILLRQPREEAPPLAVRPYPSHYVERASLDSKTVWLKPLHSIHHAQLEEFLSQNGTPDNQDFMVKDCYADFTRSIPVGLFDDQTGALSGVVKLERSPPKHLGREVAWVKLMTQKENEISITAKLLQVAIQIAANEGSTELRVSVPREDTVCHTFANWGWEPVPTGDGDGGLCAVYRLSLDGSSAGGSAKRSANPSNAMKC